MLLKWIGILQSMRYKQRISYFPIDGIFYDNCFLSLVYSPYKKIRLKRPANMQKPSLIRKNPYYKENNKGYFSLFHIGKDIFMKKIASKNHNPYAGKINMDMECLS